MKSSFNDVDINEQGKFVLKNISNFISIGPIIVSPFNPHRFQVYFNSKNWRIEEPLSSQINKWSLSLTMQKDNLYNIYDAIKNIVWRPHVYVFHMHNEFYAPGSILFSHRETLVGRVPIMLDEWVIKWYGDDINTTIISFSSTSKYVSTSILHSLANCSLTVVQ